MGESFFRSVIGPHHVLRLKFGEAALHRFTAASSHLYITHPHLLFSTTPGRVVAIVQTILTGTTGEDRVG